MSEETEKQAVVGEEVDAGATPPVETPDAQEPGLDDLLSEFDTQVSEPKPETKLDAKEADGLDDQVYGAIDKYFQTKESEQQAKTDLDEAVSALKGDDMGHLPDRIVKGYLEQMAQEDARVLTAWTKRGENPAAWKGVVAKLGERFRSELTPPVDKDQTDVADAVTAAVRGASTKAPTQTETLSMKDAGKMSDSELQAMKMGLG